MASAHPAEGVKHFHLDHLGTPRLITDSGGFQTGYHVYYPFGEEATAFNQDAEQMKFTGHERDLASSAGAGDDLDYMHARHNSPWTGRFTSTDPSQDSFDLMAPQSWNRYAYARGNPVRYIDPDGQDIWDVVEGFSDALASNLKLGQGRTTPRNADYAFGQAGGDLAAAAGAAVEFQAALVMVGGGVAFTAGTGGAGAPVGATTAVAGVVVISHSVGVLGTALSNLMRLLGIPREEEQAKPQNFCRKKGTTGRS